MNPVAGMQHVVVYRDEGQFAAWPFNCGFWQFADGELLVGFIRGPCDYASAESIHHNVVDCQHGEHVVLRSHDGGLTWPLAGLATVYTRPALDEHLAKIPASARSDDRFDPAADGYCLIGGFGIPPADHPDHAFVTISTDRGHHWMPALRIPAWGGFTAAYGRPSYIVRPDGMLLLFGHASRAGGEKDLGVPGQARPVVFGSTNGGASWGIVGEMDLTPAAPGGIMPCPLVRRDGKILAAVRRQYNSFSAYTQVYLSGDDGLSWSFLSRVNEWGAPASLTELPDGRIVCVYGYRQQPYGIRARVSGDGGATWGCEIVLRDDGGSWDLGYPRTLLRPDGSLITVYHFNTKDDPIQQGGGVRHIVATLWRI